MNHKRIPTLGIDIGKVIIDGPSHPQGGDTAFFQGDEAVLLATPEVTGACDAIAHLVDDFDGRVWLVSKCGPRVQARTERWLEGNRFHERTGLDRSHRRFCRRRSDKRFHCVELGITHFVDDHPEVHRAIRGVVEHQYLFGRQRAPVPDDWQQVNTWADAITAIRASLRPAVGLD